MSITPYIPEELTHTYTWRTSIYTSRNGYEQRVALAQEPRQHFSVGYLADSDEIIQQWRFEFLINLDIDWEFPLWGEAVGITTAVTAGGTTVLADYSLMDSELGSKMLLLHQDGVTYEIFTVLSRTLTTVTIFSGTFVNSFPLGSVIVPIEFMLIDNNSGYSAMAVNAARLSVNFLAREAREVEAVGAVALSTFNSKPVLDRRHKALDDQDVFNEKIERIDFGGRVQLESLQTRASITNSRSYISRGDDDRQWWKLFMSTVKGMWKSFYCPTYRPDMSVHTQPSVGGTTFKIYDDATVAGGWEFSPAHQNLAVSTADGDTQYVTINQFGTVDNGDGTHTVQFSPALTATTLGSTVTNVSFLELVRLGSDSVGVSYFQDNREVTLSIRTIPIA